MAKSRPSKSPKGDYPVGFGRPPVHSRFKPGQSGNPKGRPKKKPSLAEDLDAVLATRVPLRSPRGEESVPLRKAFFWKLFHDATKGEREARKLALQLVLSQLAREVEDKQEAGEAEAQENPVEDEALLQDFLRRHADKADNQEP